MRRIRDSAGNSPESSGFSRAQTAPLAVILVFAMVIAGSTLVVLVGGQAISDTQSSLDTQRAENTMTQFDSQAAMVALGNSQSQSIELESRSGGAYSVRNGSGWMNVSYTNMSSGGVTTIYNQTMGAVVYGNDDTTVAYQGGGVWKARSDGSVMVSPPEFHFRAATLTLPMVQVNGSDSIDRRAGVTKNSSRRYFPNENINDEFKNPLTNGKVNITVQSRYYEAWGQYFEQRTDGVVSYDHPQNRATLTLVSPVETKTIQSASSSLSAAGNFELQGSAKGGCGPKVYSNSYNSTGTNDGYCAQTPGTEGDILYGNDIDIATGAGNSNLRGDIVAGGNVKVASGSGKPEVYGNISYTNNCNPSDSACEDRILSGSGGSVSQVSGIQEAGDINSLVQSKADTISSSSNNDNSATGNISGNQLDYSNAAAGDTVELDAGTYYLTDITPSGGDTVFLDTSAGDITIVVKENIDLPDSATIKVVGDGVANVYIEGTGGHSTHFDMAKKSEISNDGDDAPQFRLYGQDNFTASIGDGSGNLARFVGAIYAPPGNAGSGRVDINGGLVFGGVLTGTTTIDKGSIHYDEALSEAELMSRDDKVAKLTFLHISVNRINVSG